MKRKEVKNKGKKCSLVYIGSLGETIQHHESPFQHNNSKGSIVVINICGEHEMILCRGDAVVLK